MAGREAERLAKEVRRGLPDLINPPPPMKVVWAHEALDSLVALVAAAEHEASLNLEGLVRFRDALHAILNELGVPGPDYPAPVANAVAIARAALVAGSEEAA